MNSTFNLLRFRLLCCKRLFYLNFTKVIFGVGSRFPETSALSLRLIIVKQSVALRLEVSFIDESDFENKRNGFIVKDNRFRR